METNISFVVYEFNRVMGQETHLALMPVKLKCSNGFETEQDAVNALIENEKVFENYVILKTVYLGY